MTDESELPASVRSILVPGERVVWSGRSDPLGTVATFIPNLLIASLMLAYAFEVSPVIDVVEWVVARTVGVGTVAFSDAREVTLDVIRVCLGVGAFVAGSMGLAGVATWLASFSRAWHVVTDARVVSLAGGKTSSTYLRNLAVVQSSAGRFGRQIVLAVAGGKVRHLILGVRDVDGAERAINAGIAASVGTTLR